MKASDYWIKERQCQSNVCAEKKRKSKEKCTFMPLLKKEKKEKNILEMKMVWLVWPTLLSFKVKAVEIEDLEKGFLIHTHTHTHTL